MKTGKTNLKPRARQPAVQLTGVSVARSGQMILRDINWTVPDGGCAAILGPNGSGKSTLVRVLMGQIWPTHGSVRVLGQPFGETDLNELRQSIRLVQTASVVEFDPAENVLRVVLTGFFGTIGLFREVSQPMEKRARELIKQVGLHRQATQPFRTLSSGERIRCLIARALVVKPRLLILDEPTAGLDLLAREQVLATVHRLVSRSGKTPAVLMITHHVEELMPETSEVLILKDGQVAAGGKPEKVLTSKTLSAVYDCPVKVRQQAGRYWLQVQPSAWGNVVKTFR